MHLHRPFFVSMLLCAVATPVTAQEVRVGGQVRPRSEYREPVAGADNDVFTTMRVRAEVEATLERRVTLFVQFQDVRTFGEETDPRGDFRADNIDLHQGWVAASFGNTTTLTARLGRQEIAVDDERLIGAANWSQQGRAFDGARVIVEGRSAGVEGFAVQLADATAATATDNAALFGGDAHVALGGLGTLGGHAVYRRDNADDTREITLGGRIAGVLGGIHYGFEGSYQGGDRAGTVVRAFMLHGDLGLSLGGDAVRITAWFDALSGDLNPADDTVRVFSTVFGTNHQFYGLGDYFTNIPLHTAGRGLQDVAIKTAIRPHPDVTLRLDGHRFLAEQSTGLTGSHLADEIDFVAAFRYGEHLRLSLGASRLLQQAPLAEIGRFTEDQTWAFAMIDARF